MVLFWDLEHGLCNCLDLIVTAGGPRVWEVHAINSYIIETPEEKEFDTFALVVELATHKIANDSKGKIQV